MKYKYRKTMIALQWSSVFVYAAFLLYLFHIMGKDVEWIQKNLIIAIVFLTVFIICFSGEYLNRYVDFKDEYVRFNSFRFKRLKKAVTINIKYENIYSIEACKLPLIGIWGVKITAKDLPNPIILSFCFSKHIKMYKSLCSRVRLYNSKAYIDERLKKYYEVNQ